MTMNTQDRTARKRSTPTGLPSSVGQDPGAGGEGQAPRKILTVSDLSEYLQIHRTTIYRMLKEGRLPAFRVGSDWRFSLDAIEQWQREQTNSGMQNPLR
jgi:excisionase family DNA binding protein